MMQEKKKEKYLARDLGKMLVMDVKGLPLIVELLRTVLQNLRVKLNQ